jgi:hypothetical protein
VVPSPLDPVPPNVLHDAAVYGVGRWRWCGQVDETSGTRIAFASVDWGMVTRLVHGCARVRLARPALHAVALVAIPYVRVCVCVCTVCKCARVVVQASQSVKAGVVSRLQATYGSLYTDENVCLSGTHTHRRVCAHPCACASCPLPSCVACVRPPWRRVLGCELCVLFSVWARVPVPPISQHSCGLP